MRLIDADKLKEELKSWAIVINKPQFYAVEDADYIIDCAPTISPDSLVKRGRWKKSGMLLECQSCGETYSLSGGNDDKSWTFCPSCGIPMED